jgi:endonuclease YncB( thermonuclease family)
MRPAVALGAVASIALLCVGIVAGGRNLVDSDAPSIAVEEIDPAMLELPEPDATAPEGESDTAAQPPEPASEPAPGTTRRYQRVEPRAPLSELGQAKQLQVRKPADWDGTSLHRPVSNAAGTFEAMGYSVTVAGTEPVGADETCNFKGASWPCGARARTAFRSFLRGRAVICALPAGAEPGAITAECRIGTDNMGEWLVENGWARAATGGPYAELGEKAQSAAKGVYGPPPVSIETAPPPDDTILPSFEADPAEVPLQ